MDNGTVSSQPDSVNIQIPRCGSFLGLLMSHMPQTTWTWTLQQVFDSSDGEDE